MSPNSVFRTPYRTDGFTLLELVAVLSVVALAFVLVIPNTRKAPDAVLLKTAALKLASTMRSARADAIRLNTSTAVTIDTENRQFWSDATGQRTSLAANLTLSCNGGLADANGNLRLIRFSPDGESTAAEIAIGAGKSRVAVVVDPMTGHARINWDH